MGYKSTYTYEDFQNAANKAGLYNSFSKEDLALAQLHPDAGMSLLSAKRDYNQAQTPEAQALAHAAANAIRSSYGGYTGNAAGLEYYADPKLTRQITGVLDTMDSAQPFQYGRENEYLAALNRVANPTSFRYSTTTDPLYGQYRKTYLREGQRATQNALAQASAATGGRPSSYAVSAATQAGDYYASQLSDKVADLYQMAYQRYLNEQQLQQNAYQALAADRSTATNEYQAELARQQALLSALQGQDATDYAKQQDILDRNRQAEQDRIALEQAEWTRARQEEQDRLAQEQQAWENRYREDNARYDREQQDWANRFQLALQAAAYGDYSLLAALGVEPNMQNVLSQALANAGRAVPVGYGSTGGGSGRSSGGGRRSGGGGSGNGGGTSGGGGGIDAELLEQLKSKYPDGAVTEAVHWNYLLSYYDEATLNAAGYYYAPTQQAQEAPVDQASVNALGMGPLSEAELLNLVASGAVEEYQEGGKTKFRRTGTGGNAPGLTGHIASRAPTGSNNGDTNSGGGNWVTNMAEQLLKRLGKK